MLSFETAVVIYHSVLNLAENHQLEHIDNKAKKKISAQYFD